MEPAAPQVAEDNTPHAVAADPPASLPEPAKDEQMQDPHVDPPSQPAAEAALAEAHAPNKPFDPIEGVEHACLLHPALLKPAAPCR